VEAILEDKPPTISGEDGLKALRICEAALESARIGKPVRL
jgi:predicted dehydrogenase